MKMKKNNKILLKYKNQLNKISINDADYIALLNAVVSNFFYEIKKLDRSFLIDYFNNLNKDIFVKDKVQEDAVNYLFLLVIKNTEAYEIIRDFFPSYLQSQSLQSNWLIIHWLKSVLNWLRLLTPKLELKDFPGANDLLNAIRNIKDRIRKKEIKKIHNFYDEITEFKTLAIVVNELGKSVDLHEIYSPIYEDRFLKESQQFFERQLSYVTKQELRENLDISNLMQYSTEMLSFFDGKNVYLKQNMDNLKEGIRERLLLLGSYAKPISSQINSNSLTSEFKQLLSLNISQIQFLYETFNKNLAKQNQQSFYGNILELYKNLNKLGEILYQDRNLFFYSINQASSIDYIIDLSGTLDTLSRLAELLKSIAKEIDPRTLEKDIFKLSEDISLHLSVIKENLGPYTENNDFIMRSVSYRNSSSNSDFNNRIIPEVVHLDSEREEDDESKSGYSDQTSFQSSNSSFSETEKNGGLSKNNSALPGLHSFFGAKCGNYCLQPISQNILGMIHA
jgi:hypothetical protein